MTVSRFPGMRNMQRSEVCFSLNEAIYSKEAIDQAILDYSKVCTIERTETGLCLRPKGEHDAQLLKDEFCNYVLGMMKNG
jgi:hypothetical protein